MKYNLAVLALFGYLCCVAALPATSKSIDDSVEFVAQKEGGQPIIDTGVIGFDIPFSNPFSGFLDQFDSLMNQVKQQMDSLLNQFPGFRTSNSSDDFPRFPAFGEIAPFPKFDDIDLGKGNTTSETKIIDGHKVVINETQYRKDSANGSAFFKVRVIDVKPDESTENNTEDASTARAIPVNKDREAIENSVENEIFKNNEAIYYQPIESDHVDSASQIHLPNFAYQTDNSEWSDFNRIEPIEDNSLSFINAPADLSRDTYVNELLAQSGATVNPDAEIIEVVPQGSNLRPLPDRIRR